MRSLTVLLIVKWPSRKVAFFDVLLTLKIAFKTKLAKVGEIPLGSIELPFPQAPNVSGASEITCKR